MVSAGIGIADRIQTAAIPPTVFFSNSCSNGSQFLKQRSLYSSSQRKRLRNLKAHSSRRIVYAAQFEFLKVVQTVWKVGKDGVDAGTNMVPAVVPRPIARAAVAVAAAMAGLFVLKSFLSTALFALAVMGLCYFTFIALNKNEGPKGNGGTTSVEDSLEEARRIMDKYK
ncbi:uncharacterized protein LOC127242955 [Andrographis paniculata]|uniref:uncharacterized protein LOC127242955 n=1 Tax=Andrographis paniculata TaxID=175694 RepID=UPI0021E6DFCA|nr:uncharacterized protein LOC127242955 [Andrographis paniculata]